VGDGGAYLINPLGGRTIPVIIGQLVAWFGAAGGSLFFLYLLWGGFQWMMAGGDHGKVQSAQKRIVAAVLGITVILFAYMLVSSIIGVVPQ
jgi:hypothetical protein